MRTWQYGAVLLALLLTVAAAPAPFAQASGSDDSAATPNQSSNSADPASPRWADGDVTVTAAQYIGQGYTGTYFGQGYSGSYYTNNYWGGAGSSTTYYSNPYTMYAYDLSYYGAYYPYSPGSYTPFSYGLYYPYPGYYPMYPWLAYPVTY